MTAKKYDEPFCADVIPEYGGNIRTEVSGWGTWNIWLGIESYVDGHDQTAMGPADALRVAWHLVLAAVVCAWKRARSRRG